MRLEMLATPNFGIAGGRKKVDQALLKGHKTFPLRIAQCIGYNEQLYRKLLEKHEESVTEAMLAREGSGMVPAKESRKRARRDVSAESS